MATKRVSRLHDHLGFWHNQFGRAVHTDFERRLAAFDVTVAQWAVMVLVFHGEAATVRGLAQLLDLDAGAVTRLIDRLAAKDLARRLPDPDDGRSVLVQLTEAGRGLVPELAAAADVNDEAWYGRLSDREVRLYKRLLAKLAAATGTAPDQAWANEPLRRPSRDGNDP